MRNNSIFTVPLVQYLQTIMRNNFNEFEQIFEILQLLRATYILRIYHYIN